MAIWQYQWHLYPREQLKSLLNWRALDLTVDSLDELNLWKDFELQTDFEAALSNLLLKSQPWSDDITFYGDASTSDIHVYKESWRICSVLFRLDIQQPNKKLFTQFLELLTRYELACFSESELILNPDKINLTDSVKKSSAYKFLTNPEEFLKSLPKLNEE